MTTPARMLVFSYGSHTLAGYDAKLLATVPYYLVDNVTHGFWGEKNGYDNPAFLDHAGILQMQAAGMKVIGYTSTGYEGSGSAGNHGTYIISLPIVKKQIYNMIVLDGCDGVFFDECSSSLTPYPPDNPVTLAKQAYLRECASYTQSLGGIAWFNTGVNDI